MPVAFVVLQPGATLGATDEGRLRALVQSRLGSVATPAKFVIVDALPETYSGKFVRRLLQSILAAAPLGDLGGLKNPECVAPLQDAVRAVMASPSRGLATQSLAIVSDVVRSVTGIEHVSPSAPLFKLGMNSLSVCKCMGMGTCARA